METGIIVCGFIIVLLMIVGAACQSMAADNQQEVRITNLEQWRARMQRENLTKVMHPAVPDSPDTKPQPPVVPEPPFTPPAEPVTEPSDDEPAVRSHHSYCSCGHEQGAHANGPCIKPGCRCKSFSLRK
jgi:hypothetical protein